MVVDDNVITIAFKTVPITDHDWSHGFQTMNNEPSDFVKEFVSFLFASSGLQKQPQILHGQLSSVNVIVIFAMFLNGNVGQVDVHVVHFVDGVIVLGRAKTSESVLVQIHFQRPE